MLAEYTSPCGDLPSARLEISMEAEAQRPKDEPLNALVVRFPEDAGIEPWRIWIADRRVHCGDQALDLARCPAMLRLFRTFCEGRQFMVQREALLYFINGHREVIGCSDRLLESKRANCIKMISRARILADAQLSGAHAATIEWFPYDYGARAWHLLGLRRPQLH